MSLNSYVRDDQPLSNLHWECISARSESQYGHVRPLLLDAWRCLNVKFRDDSPEKKFSGMIHLKNIYQVMVVHVVPFLFAYFANVLTSVLLVNDFGFVCFGMD